MKLLIIRFSKCKQWSSVGPHAYAMMLIWVSIQFCRGPSATTATSCKWTKISNARLFSSKFTTIMTDTSTLSLSMPRSCICRYLKNLTHLSTKFPRVDKKSNFWVYANKIETLCSNIMFSIQKLSEWLIKFWLRITSWNRSPKQLIYRSCSENLQWCWNLKTSIMTVSTL